MPDAAFGVRQALDVPTRKASLPALDPVFTTSALEVQLEPARHGRAVLVLPPFSMPRDDAAGTLAAVLEHPMPDFRAEAEASRFRLGVRTRSLLRPHQKS